MATESIKSPSKTLTKHYESYGVNMTLIASGAIAQNQEVYISANNTVAKRTTGVQIPIGIATVGGADGDKIAVQSNVLRDSLGIATGGTLAAGALVKQNGTVNADGIPQYVAGAVGDYLSAIVLQGGAANAEIRVLHLRGPIYRAS